MINVVIKLPILLVVVFILLMSLIDTTDVITGYAFQYQTLISSLLFIVGVIIVAVGGYQFKKANTTVNPMTPEKATQLVTVGLYRYSRNPMYIGFLFWLIACALFLGNPVNLLLLPLYVFLVNKLYITPEENALEVLFEGEFRKYKKRVRRWL